MTRSAELDPNLAGPSRRMRVAVFATMPANTYSGGRYYALMLAEALAHGGHEVYFVTNQTPVFFDDMKSFPRHERLTLVNTPDFRTSLPGGDFDFVILIPAASFAGYYARVEIFALQRGAHLVFVNFESGNWFNALSPTPRPLSEWAPWLRAVRGASVVLSISEEGNKWAKTFYRNHPRHTRFEFCYPPINTPAANSVRGVQREKRILLFMRFSTARHKGSESINELFCEAVRGYTLVFVLGKEDVPSQTMAQLASLARDYDVKLEFKPRLSDVEKFRELKRARLVVFPSLFEGYGYPPVEALYCGTPCVAFQLPVLEETCGELLCYADHGDWEGFRRQIEGALSVPWDAAALRNRVRRIAPLDTATETLERVFGEMTQAGPVPAQERDRRLATLIFQERWRLNDIRLRMRATRQDLRRRTTAFISRQAKRLKRRRRVSEFVARQVRRLRSSGTGARVPGSRFLGRQATRLRSGAKLPRRAFDPILRKLQRIRARGKVPGRVLEFAARQIKRIRARNKTHHRVCYYPAFDVESELTSHWHRAKWYLPFVRGICEEVIFPVQSGLTPGPAPDYMCDTPADQKHLKLRSGRLSVLREALRSGVILVWKKGYSSPLLDFLGPLCGIPIVNVATDDLGSREYGTYCSLLWKHLTPPLERNLILSDHRQRFSRLAERLKGEGFERSCVFGTGPSLEMAAEFDYGKSLNVVCNSIVQNRELLDHIRPQFICAGDVVSHLGVSTYADRFRSDLIRVLNKYDTYFLTTADFGSLFLRHHPELEQRVFLIEQTTNNPNFDLSIHYGAPRLDSTLNIHMLPLAATFSDEIWLLGCDGKSEVRDNEDFWAHAKQAQYHDLVNTGHLCHPTFDVHRQASTYDRFIASTAKTIETGEMFRGIAYQSLVPSRIPVLASRSVDPKYLASADGKRPYSLDEIRKAHPCPQRPSAARAAGSKGEERLPFKTAISKCAFQQTNVLVVSGWALSEPPVNRVEIWLGDAFLGVANLRMHRKDIAAKFPEYSESDSGFQFYARTNRGERDRMIAKIRIFSSDCLMHEEVLTPKDN